MDLCDAVTEATYFWLQRTFQFNEKEEGSLTWRVPTSEVYSLYKNWVRNTKFAPLPIEDIWGIIQLAFPFVRIVGGKGSRSFTAMRMGEVGE